jgi:iron complex outermembrane receptor protein
MWLLATSANAADSNSQEPAFASPFAPKGAIETVIVTARRREEDIQKVPLEVTALSPSDLRDGDVRSALDLQNLVPSLTVAGTLGSRDTNVFSIRGQNQPFGGADPGVQTYFAEIPFGASGVGNEFDLASVQVLSGPQGTLFGRNTTGGAVLFEPKKPDDAFGGYLDAQLGNYNLENLRGAVNVPVISDRFMVRAAGDFEHRDGFTKDISTGQNLDNVNYYAFRIGATVHPFAGLENYAVFNYLHDENSGTGAVLTGINTTTLDKLGTQELQPVLQPFQLRSCPLPSSYQNYPSIVGVVCGALLSFEQGMVNALSEQEKLGSRATTSNIMPRFKRDTWDAVDIARYDITDSIYIRNIFGYISDKQQSGFDYAGTALPILDVPNNRTWEFDSVQATDELQLAGATTDKSINWIAGFYHELDHPGGYGEASREAFGMLEIDALNNGGTSNAAYGSTTYDASAWVNGLSFTAGGRYTWDHKFSRDLSCIPPPSCPLPIPDRFPYNFPGPVYQSAYFRAPSWTLAANYQVTDDTMLYATYRRGYKSGGFNSGAGAAAAEFGEFKPEYLTDVEVGSKNNWTILDVPGRTNLDLYYGWYQDVQKNDLVDLIGNGSVQPVALTFNAARATIKGLDFQSVFVPDDNFEVDVFYSYTDASYDRFLLPQAFLNGTPTFVDLTGNAFSYTPKHKLGISPKLHIPIDPALGAPYVSSIFYWQSEEWFTDLGSEQTTCSAFLMPSPPPGGAYTCLAPGGQQPVQRSYAVFNFRFDWNDFLGEGFDLSFFLDNAFDHTYQVAGNALLNLTGTNASIYAPPRMWGFEVRYRFGEDAATNE